MYKYMETPIKVVLVIPAESQNNFETTCKPIVYEWFFLFNIKFTYTFGDLPPPAKLKTAIQTSHILY
jgi:hypothetical protein